MLALERCLKRTFNGFDTATNVLSEPDGLVGDGAREIGRGTGGIVLLGDQMQLPAPSEGTCRAWINVNVIVKCDEISVKVNSRAHRELQKVIADLSRDEP